MTVAVGLIVLAALAVVGAALSGSWLVVTIAAVLSVVLGAAATRITHTELVESRVAAAKDRAIQAKAYLLIHEERSAEDADYLQQVRARLAEREQSLDELEQALSLSQRRAATSLRSRNAEGRRAAALEAKLVETEALVAADRLRIAELEAEADTLRSELHAVTAAWHAAEHQRKHA
ncbi:hypothetical protein [Nocardioides flavescens]|nr:hypothetical protein [Nocardioides flavescens]